MTIHLPDRPGRYGYGPNMPVGRINVQELDCGACFTVTRVVDGGDLGAARCAGQPGLVDLAELHEGSGLGV